MMDDLDGATTLSVTTFSITSLGIAQYNGINCDICHNLFYHYAECHYAECYGSFNLIVGLSMKKFESFHLLLIFN